ncbi:9802_t:CDS:2 [Ambispora leptoticha]|uniref:9802_t:CDS:1 n=1 Tax=Ambispora leptoticha TaxID=144679 RepID=A0A9N8WAK8_9GLOM|nr:9802_t:CDS:2 [Ambispora leptoticha]
MTSLNNNPSASGSIINNSEHLPLNGNDGGGKLSTTNGASNINLPSTQHKLSRAEIVHGLANRILYSRFYTWLYLGMAALSTVSIILSIEETCPSIWFIILEVIINVAMIAEVTTRFFALKQLFWRSVYNIVDIILVFLCVLTVLFILAGGCSSGQKSEELLDTLLLVARNLVQFGRLIVMLRKNKKNRSARNARIDFSDVRPPSVSIDFESASNNAFSAISDDEDDLL